MTTDPYTATVEYHEQTKHHPRRFARSLGFLDWNTQPDPFRRFDGAPRIELPLRARDNTPPYEDLFEPGCVTPAPLSVDTLSRFLETSMAISAWKQAGPSRWALRCNPSSGNLHPTEAYLVLPAIRGVCDAAGVYHYASRTHALEQRCRLSPSVWSALADDFGSGAFLVGLSSIFWREAWKYGERAFRYCQHDVGHALGGLRIAAAVLGWKLTMLDHLADDEIAAVLGLDRTADFAGAEAERPELLAVVRAAAGRTRSRGLPEGAIHAVAAGAWVGRANALSPTHVDWDIIDVVAEATRKPKGTTAPGDLSARESSRARVTEVPSCGLTARQITLQRRSAVAFDGETSISAVTFYHMLARVVPCKRHPAPPWDAITWPPKIHLFLFVHLVDGLRPGVYALVRDAARLETIKSATKADFLWQRPDGCPDGLPLYLLVEGDCRRLAAQLSLGQEIAGMCAFSLGMVAEFEASLREIGPWFYRHLFWEAGMVGQVLYLEAEAAGVRATGIGAYFDDPVHEILGLADRRFQSLYHFTVGGPVDDPRITTLPPYPADRYGQ